MADDKKTDGNPAPALAIVPPVEEGEQAEYEHAEIRRTVLARRDKAEESYWGMASVLREIYDGSLYSAWGYTCWKDYIEQELDWHIKKGQIFVQLQKGFDVLPSNVQKWIRSLGWGKAAMLIRVVNPENAAEWRKKVEGKTLREISDMLSAAKKEDATGSSGPSESSDMKKMSFTLAIPQHENVTMALGKCEENANSDKPGHLLDLICTEYLATNAGNFSVRDYLTNIERSYGLKLLAYDEETEAVVHGDALLRMVKDMTEAEMAEDKADDAEMDAEGDSNPESAEPEEKVAGELAGGTAEG